jgi:hypothetical protein
MGYCLIDNEVGKPKYLNVHLSQAQCPFVRHNIRKKARNRTRSYDMSAQNSRPYCAS